MSKRKFKTESQRILDLMVNSIYTHKEIFLRELISNASDAIDKLYFKRLGEGGGAVRSEYGIALHADREKRTLTVSDNGIGMSESELENNLGVIAKSGSLEFKKENEMPQDVDIIGQFGVGFYSAFMVAKKVTVISRAYGSEQAFRWRSDGMDGYTIDPCEKSESGTTVVLELKDDTEQEKYSEFLDQYRIKEIVRRYSDYIRYPITMECTHSQPKPDTEGEYETVTEVETLNSMVPLWQKNKSEITDQEYNDFYKSKFRDYQDPAAVIHQRTEGAASFRALMFIPSRAPFNYYSKEYQKGLMLYSSGVMISESQPDLLPDCFGFVQGIVDSDDLSLNISREMLQHDRQLKLIASTLEKRIKKELADMLANDREKYEKFFANFGLTLKYGVYADFGAKRELLQDLLLFRSATKDAMVTLSEYVQAMPAEQKYIFYAAGSKQQNLKKLPAAERVLDSGFDVLLLNDEIDEFALSMLRSYAEKEFRSVTDKELDISPAEDKEEAEQAAQENSALLEKLKTALEGKVEQVTVSSRLKSHPVCITTEGGLSIEMERVLNNLPGAEKVDSKRILELNPRHSVFEALTKLEKDGDEQKLALYARVLYNQALLIEGLLPEDAVAYCEDVAQLMDAARE